MHQTNREFPVIETARLILRSPVQADAGALLALTQSRAVMVYYGMQRYETEMEALGEIAWFNGIYRDGQGIRWAISLKSAPEFIGDIGFHNYATEHNRAEVGYKLAEPYWRQGIMSEAMRAALEYGFGPMNLNRVEALVDPRNTASLGLLHKAGFAQEGVLREYELEAEGYVDLAMLSLLRREWASTPTPDSEL